MDPRTKMPPGSGGRQLNLLPRTDRSLVVIAAVMVLAVVGFLVWVAADVLALTFAGLLMAVFLRGMSNAMGRLTGFPENWSLVIVLSLLAILLGLIGWFLGAEIINQFDEFLPGLQTAWGQLRDQVAQYDWGKTLLANTSLKSLARDREWLTRVTGGFFSSTLGAVASLLVVFFIGLYGAAAPPTYLQGLLRLVPLDRRQRATEVMEAVSDILHWWLIGTFAKMTVVGIAISCGLLLLDIPLALALGIIAFLFEFVPYVGPVLAAIPALLVALAVGPTELLYVALLYLGVQTAEGYIISPLVDQRSVNLPPALAIVSQILLGTSALGLLGVFIAAPLTAVVIILVKMLYIEDWLGECTDISPVEEGAACVPASLPSVPGEPGPPEGGKVEARK